MRLSTGIAFAAAAAVALTAAGLLILHTMDWSRHKEAVTAHIAAALGRNVAITGALRLQLLPRPSFVAEGLTIANAEGGSRPNMLEAELVAAELPLLPLVLGREVQIRRLLVRRADLLLETDTEGRGNWRLQSEQVPADPGDLGVLQHVAVEELKVRFRPAAAPEGLTFLVQHLTVTAAAEGALDLQANLQWRAAPFELVARLDRSPALQPAEGHALQGRLASPGMSLAFEGRVAEPLAGRGLRLALTGEASGRSAGDLLGRSLPDDRLSLSARLEADLPRTVSLQHIEAGLPQSHITGQAALTLGGARPEIQAELAVDRMDLRDWLAVGSSNASIGRLNDWLALADGELKLNLARLETGGAPLEHVALWLVLSDRILELRQAAANVFATTASGTGSADARGLPELALTPSAPQLDLGQALRRLAGSDVLEGRADLQLQGRGRGRSLPELWASLQGEGSIVMSGGRLNSQLLELLGADLVQLVTKWVASDKPTAINCFVARFDIRDGMARSRGILLDSATVTMQGEGTINLASEAVQMTLKPRPKDAGLISLAVPIHVGGTVRQPSFTPDAGSVAAGVAGAAALAVINPLGVLLPFLGGGAESRNPCLAALDGPARRPEPQPREGRSGSERR